MKNQQLSINIDEFVSPISVTGHESMKISEAAKLMQDGGFRHLPIIKDKKPIGIISARDISILGSLKDVEDINVSEVMVKEPYCAYTGSLISDVALEMSSRKIGSALILSTDGSLDGIFTSIDGLNALIEIARGEIL